MKWFECHGRKDLPWQQVPRTPYRVCVSELMLQQTQVRTVVPYYQRFMERFPNIQTVATAPLDEVLHLWSGLGYYARARNLHAAAKIIHCNFGGHFPAELETLLKLPGISRSTAGAILTLAMGQRQPILDGNVKRVLTRYYGIEGWPRQPAIEKRLWGLAEQHTPAERVAEYSQTIMDLGALYCTRHNPRCLACPLQGNCAARRLGLQSSLPTPAPSKKRGMHIRQVTMVILQKPAGEVLLEQRPAEGIWGGLWSFPECPEGVDPIAWCRDHLCCSPKEVRYGTSIRHTLTHCHLDLFPLYIRVQRISRTAME